jgi:hypothetical protein
MTAAEFLTGWGKGTTLCIRFVLSLGDENEVFIFLLRQAEAQLGNQEFTFVQLKTGLWLKRGLQALHESQAEFVAKLVHQ